MTKKKANYRHENTCYECGKTFLSVRSDARYCCAKCKKNASLRNIAERKAIEEHEFAVALHEEERHVCANKLLELVSAIQTRKHKLEVRNNGERLLREYNSAKIKRENKMRYERELRAKEIRQWNSIQEQIRAEKTRQANEYLAKVIVALNSIRTHQHYCKCKCDIKDRLNYEREMREKEYQYKLEREKEQERTRIEREKRKDKERKQHQQKMQLISNIITRAISRL